MKASEQSRFDTLYQRHLRALKLQGLSDSTIDVYARAVRRLTQHYHCCPDQLSTEQLEVYFAKLVESHSWSTVKVDRNGLQFFWRHVLKRDWTWLDIIRAPKIQSLPDILTVAEVEQLIGATRQLRYRVFLLATYSMGLRLGETLAEVVPSASTTQPRNGWIGNAPNSCPWITSWRPPPSPYERRALAWQHQSVLYTLMITTATNTLKDFGRNPKHLGAELGMTAVLHTHSRRLDYHPPVHIVVPGGGIDPRRRQWKKTQGKYLFNAFALAKVEG